LNCLHKPSCVPLGTASYKVPKRLQCDTTRRQHLVPPRLAQDPLRAIIEWTEILTGSLTSFPMQQCDQSAPASRYFQPLRIFGTTVSHSSMCQAADRHQPDLHLTAMVQGSGSAVEHSPSSCGLPALPSGNLPIFIAHFQSRINISAAVLSRSAVHLENA
jgi:hypothetical protein